MTAKVFKKDILKKINKQRGILCNTVNLFQTPLPFYVTLFLIQGPLQITIKGRNFSQLEILIILNVPLVYNLLCLEDLERCKCHSKGIIHTRCSTFLFGLAAVFRICKYKSCKAIYPNLWYKLYLKLWSCQQTI